MDNLPSLLSFVRVAEAGSFVGAANRLGVSASAVGKNVARLEATLGARLFEPARAGSSSPMPARCSLSAASGLCRSCRTRKASCSR